MESAQARAHALGWLARREYSTHELTQKLLAKGASAAVAAEVVAGLAEQRLLSDARFIEAFVRARMQRGYGPLWIREALRQRGIDATAIEAAIDPTDPVWLSQLQVVWRKKFGGRRPATMAARASQSRFLRSRGFTADQIRRVLNSRESTEF